VTRQPQLVETSREVTTAIVNRDMKKAEIDISATVIAFLTDNFSHLHYQSDSNLDKGQFWAICILCSRLPHNHAHLH